MAWPAHRSLLEFFVAFKVAAELGALPSDFTALAQNQSNEDNTLNPRDYTWNSYFRREKDESGNIRPMSPLRKFSPDNTGTVLDTLACLDDSVLRFVYEITNVGEVLGLFHGFLANVLDQFKDETRDPKKEQGVLGIILRLILHNRGLLLVTIVISSTCKSNHIRIVPDSHSTMWSTIHNTCGNTRAVTSVWQQRTAIF